MKPADVVRGILTVLDIFRRLVPSGSKLAPRKDVKPIDLSADEYRRMTPEQRKELER